MHSVLEGTGKRNILGDRIQGRKKKKMKKKKKKGEKTRAFSPFSLFAQKKKFPSFAQFSPFSPFSLPPFHSHSPLSPPSSPSLTLPLLTSSLSHLKPSITSLLVFFGAIDEHRRSCRLKVCDSPFFHFSFSVFHPPTTSHSDLYRLIPFQKPLFM